MNPVRDTTYRVQSNLDCTMSLLCKVSNGMKRGFSLLETVVIIGVTVMALLALVNLFLIFNTLYGYQQAFMATAGSSGVSMNALEAAILPANRVVASRDFSGTIYASATTTLVLELPAIDEGGDIIAGANDYVAFYTDSATLYRLIETDASSVRTPGLKQLSATLSSLSFSYDAADVTQATNITVDLQTAVQFKQEPVQSHLTGQWYLRNLTPSL